MVFASKAEEIASILQLKGLYVKMIDGEMQLRISTDYLQTFVLC